MHGLLDSIRLRVILIVLACLLPTFLLSYCAEREQRRAVRASVEAELRHDVGGMAARIGRLIADTDVLLSAIARAPAAADPASEACGALMTAFAEGYGRYAALGIADTTGRLLCGSAGAADGSWLDVPRESGRDAAGGIRPHRLGGEDVFVVARPLAPDAAVGAAVSVAWLEDMLRAVQQSHDGRLAVLEPTGRVLAQAPPGAVFGRDAVDPSLFRARAGSGGTVLVAADPDGAGERLFAVRPWREDGLSLILVSARPVAEIDALTAPLAGRSALLLLVLGLGAVLLAWVGGRALLVAPIETLARRAGAIGRADDAPPPGSTRMPAELQPLGAALERAAALIARRERELAETQRLARIGTWRWDLATNETEWSASMYPLLGLDPARGPLSFERFLELVEPESRDAVRRWIDGVRETGAAATLEYAVLLPSGERVHVWSAAEGSRDTAGRVVAAAGACLDVTARRAAEIAQAESEARHRALVEAAPVAILLCVDRRIRLANPAALAVLGVGSIDALIGRSPYDFVAENPYSRGADPVFGAVIGRAPAPNRYQVRRGDGSIGYAEVATVAATDGSGHPAEIMFLDDVSPEVEVEAVHRALFAGSQDGILLTSPRQAVLAANAAARAELGMPLDETVPVPPGRVFDFDDPAMLAAFEERRRTGRFRGELTLYRLDGGKFPAEVVSTLFRTPAGDERSWVVFRDITERKAVEERLRHAQRMEAIGQLTDGIAHDFNNLLTVIIGNAEMIREMLESRPEVTRLAEASLAAAERGADLTNRLLAFARRQPLQPQAIDVNGLLYGMAELLRRAMRENIELDIVSADDLASVEADPSHLETAILNIVANARDAMPDGGSIRIETANATFGDGGIEPPADLAPGRYVSIAISDTGEGMAPAVAARAFDPFFTTRTVGEGSGLGLSMVYGFMRQSGGGARIDSAPGRGTTITLLLPAAGPAAAERPDAPDAPNAEPRGRERILLVEDDPLVLEHVRAQLDQLGYTVVAATDAAAALVVLDAGEPVDLMITDIALPGDMDGIALAAAAPRPGPPVLFTSGYTENALARDGRLPPGAELLSKPYRRIDLARRVRALLDAAPHR